MSNTSYLSSAGIEDPNLDDVQRTTGELVDGPSMMLEQLQRLIHLVDQSDTVELEIKQSNLKSRLVLRKAKPVTNEAAYVTHQDARESESHGSVDEVYIIVAPFVGLVQLYTPSNNKPLVATGEKIKEQQNVCWIQSMGLLNEVESAVAGQIVELLVQHGQPVEYGQPLMKIMK